MQWNSQAKSQDIFIQGEIKPYVETSHLFCMFCILLLPSRCFGGEVSWDKSVCIGSTYEVTDETITHQIVDRPNVDKQYINR